MTNTVEIVPTRRTVDGLRDLLFQEIDGLRAGTVAPYRAAATAKLALAIIASVKIQIEVEDTIHAQGKFRGSSDLPSLTLVR